MGRLDVGFSVHPIIDFPGLFVLSIEDYSELTFFPRLDRLLRIGHSDTATAALDVGEFERSVSHVGESENRLPPAVALRESAKRG